MNRPARTLPPCILLVSLLLAGCGPVLVQDEARAREVVGRYHGEVRSEGRTDLLASLHHEDLVVRMEDGQTLEGPTALAGEIRNLRRAFPDWNERVEAVLVEGERVATRVVATGTHRGPFRGIAPTGRRVEVVRLNQFRLRSGRVARQWSLTDLADLEQQLRD
jgi:steroid delta-isomerase-like uncharacterized protein